MDVSVDGGRNWRTARLEGPKLSKALTRFNFDWVWDGKPAILQSRAIDSTGYVQPKINQLRAVRGTRSIYHNKRDSILEDFRERRSFQTCRCTDMKSMMQTLNKPLGQLMAALVICGVTFGVAHAKKPWDEIGRDAKPAEIAAWDIDVRPDFKGLPAGLDPVRSRHSRLGKSMCQLPRRVW